jgi:AraC-like DNA-binding protein
MSDISKLLSGLTKDDGFTYTGVEGVILFKSHKSANRCPVMYEPNIVIIAQGKKTGYLGSEVFTYDENNYLIVTVPMPFECKTDATQENPLLGMYISIDLPMLRELISQMKFSEKVSESAKGFCTAPMDEGITDSVKRLLKSMYSQNESRVLGKPLVREILYRALTGTQAGALLSLAMYNGNYSKIASALYKIHSKFNESISVEELAQDAGMSVSLFHRAFKEYTLESPIQYLKKIRLNKAKKLILNGNERIYSIAEEVGYESVSQFSREFKRYFGHNPSETMVL